MVDREREDELTSLLDGDQLEMIKCIEDGTSGDDGGVVDGTAELDGAGKEIEGVSVGDGEDDDDEQELGVKGVATVKLGGDAEKEKDVAHVWNGENDIRDSLDLDMLLRSSLESGSNVRRGSGENIVRIMGDGSKKDPMITIGEFGEDEISPEPSYQHGRDNRKYSAPVQTGTRFSTEAEVSVSSSREKSSTAMVVRYKKVKKLTRDDFGTYSTREVMEPVYGTEKTATPVEETMESTQLLSSPNHTNRRFWDDTTNLTAATNGFDENIKISEEPSTRSSVIVNRSQAREEDEIVLNLSGTAQKRGSISSKPTQSPFRKHELLEIQKRLQDAICNTREEKVVELLQKLNTAHGSKIDISDLDMSYNGLLDKKHEKYTISMLAVAASTGCYTILDHLLKQTRNHNLNAGFTITNTLKQDNDGAQIIQHQRSPLQYASAHGFHRIVKLLLSHHADPNPANTPYSGESPLILALQSPRPVAYLQCEGLYFTSKFDSDEDVDRADTIEALLRSNANVNVCTFDEHRKSAIFFAMSNKELLETLLSAGADVNFADGFGNTIFHLFCQQSDDVEMLKLLVSYGYNLESDHCKAAHICIVNHRVKCLMYLRKLGVALEGDISQGIPSVLQVAVSVNDAALCGIILDFPEFQIDWDFRQHGKNLFHRIALHQNLKIFKMIVFGCQGHQAKIANLLNQSTGKLTHLGEDTPLYYSYPSCELANWMIRYGADVKRLNFVQSFRHFKESRPFIELLLRHKIEVNTSCNGKSPIWMAFEEARLDLLALMLENGAEVDIPGIKGRTLLHECCMKGFAPFVELLLKHGANPRRVCNRNKDALAYAKQDLAHKTSEDKSKVIDLVYYALNS